MATRSAIGIQQEDGSVIGIYCHWDGYVDHNGRILNDHYDRDKTMALMDLGDLSVLGKELGEKQDFDSPTDRNWCLAYGRDRGERDINSVAYHDPNEFYKEFKNAGVDYCYLLEGDKWLVRGYDEDHWQRVDILLGEEVAA